MQIKENSFNKNMVMFDASASLTYIRTNAMHNELYGIVETTNEKEVRYYYPRLYNELSAYLAGKSNYKLILFREKNKDRWEDYIVTGSATVFVISSIHGSQYTPGSIITLEEHEQINLKFEDFLNHFVGVAHD